MIFPRQKEDGSRSREGWFRAWFVMFAFSMVLLLAHKHFSWMGGVERFLHATVYSPLRGVLHSPLSGVNNSWHDWRNGRDLLARARDLQTENLELRTQIQLLGHYQAENRRLRMLMDSVGTVTEPVMIAEILDTNIEGYRETILINKGREDGVYLQQAVIDPFGLVGQVTDVYPRQARIMLISDGRSRVPVYIDRTQQRVLVAGTAENGTIMLENIRLDSDIREGDRLVSSGLGGVYPRGYPVAEVVAVERDQRNSFLTVRLHSLAHLHSMLEVLLLNQRNVPEDVVLPVGPPRPPSAEGQEISP